MGNMFSSFVTEPAVGGGIANVLRSVKHVQVSSYSESQWPEPIPLMAIGRSTPDYVPPLSRQQSALCNVTLGFPGGLWAVGTLEFRGDLQALHKSSTDPMTGLNVVKAPSLGDFYHDKNNDGFVYTEKGWMKICSASGEDSVEDCTSDPVLLAEIKQRVKEFRLC